jgi:hypothetical protein
MDSVSLSFEKTYTLPVRPSCKKSLPVLVGRWHNYAGRATSMNKRSLTNGFETFSLKKLVQRDPAHP